MGSLTIVWEEPDFCAEICGEKADVIVLLRKTVELRSRNLGVPVPEPVPESVPELNGVDALSADYLSWRAEHVQKIASADHLTEGDLLSELIRMDTQYDERLREAGHVVSPPASIWPGSPSLLRRLPWKECESMQGYLASIGLDPEQIQAVLCDLDALRDMLSTIDAHTISGSLLEHRAALRRLGWLGGIPWITFWATWAAAANAPGTFFAPIQIKGTSFLFVAALASLSSMTQLLPPFPEDQQQTISMLFGHGSPFLPEMKK